MGAGHSFTALQKSKSQFQDLLDLKHETGGYFNTKTNEFAHTTTAKGLLIKSLAEYPKTSGIIAWHTHPDIVEEKLKVPYPIISIPSNIDIMTSLEGSLHYKEPTINIVLSNSGICVYYPNEKLMKFLLSKTETEQQDILKSYVKSNLNVIYHEIFIETSKNQKEKFIQEMKDLTNKGEGYYIKFYDWK